MFVNICNLFAKFREFRRHTSEVMYLIVDLSNSHSLSNQHLVDFQKYLIIFRYLTKYKNKRVLSSFQISQYDDDDGGDGDDDDDDDDDADDDE